jgi:DNA (cytosine-5)-methyltransferase 1
MPPASQRIETELIQLGYQVEARIIDMYEYGVPQRRKRYILVGATDSKPKVFFSSLAQGCSDFLASKGLTANATVDQAIGDLMEEKRNTLFSL